MNNKILNNKYKLHVGFSQFSVASSVWLFGNNLNRAFSVGFSQSRFGFSPCLFANNLNRAFSYSVSSPKLMVNNSLVIWSNNQSSLIIVNINLVSSRSFSYYSVSSTKLMVNNSLVV